MLIAPGFGSVTLPASAATAASRCVASCARPAYPPLLETSRPLTTELQTVRASGGDSLVGMTSTRAALYGRQSRNKTTSIEDQLAECRAEAEGARFVVVAEYRDGQSASRYARKTRADWALVLAAIERREFDVLILWEASRGDRTLTTWSQLLDLCRERDVRIHVVTGGGRTYDMSIDSDWHTMAMAGVTSASESAHTSDRVSRGVAANARRGRPGGGPAPYGYRRTYDPNTGDLTGQVIDPETCEVAREIVRRVGKGEPLSVIVRDLNEREVPPPGRRIAGMGGQQWYRERVRLIAKSPVYIGQRAHRPGRGTGKEGERAVYAGTWPALVTEAEHYAALRALAGPTHVVKNARPGRQVWLLTHLAECGTPGCGARLRAHQGGTYLVCPTGHVSMKREPIDAFVVAVVHGYLSDPEQYGALVQASDADDKAASEARAEVDRLDAELRDWRDAAGRGEVTRATMTTVEEGLAKRIKDATARADLASTPIALRGFTGPLDVVRARWEAASLAAQRNVIRTCLRVRLMPGVGRRGTVDERVRITGPADKSTVE